MRSKIIVNFQMHRPFFEDLKDIGKVRFGPFSTEQKLKKELKDAEALVIAFVSVTEDLLKNAPNLKIVARLGVGYDTVDVDVCSRKGVYVTHTPNVLSNAVAELTIGLVLCLSRRILPADYYVRNKWGHAEECFTTCNDLKGKTVGIIGLGRIGCALAHKLQAFDVELLYHDVKRNSSAENTLDLKYSEMNDLLGNSDFVTIHVPLTRKTFGIIGERELKLMKKTAYLINTSRGPVVDEDALCRALEREMIAGAALDVFKNEPLPKNSPLINMKNVVLTPHMGTNTLETRRAMAFNVIENVKSALKGKKPPNVVPEQREMTF